jgi:RNA polymerase sigma-70 factor (ECF subfamily)
MDAEEVVQDVMMAIANKIDRFRGEANLTTWIHRITVNAALMQRRKDRSSSVVFLDTTSSDGALHETRLSQSPPVDRTLTKELWTIVWDAVDALDSKYRTVFVLRDVEGLTTEETAQALGLGIAAVKSRLHRARKTLKGRLAWYFDGSSRERFAVAA